MGEIKDTRDEPFPIVPALLLACLFILLFLVLILLRDIRSTQDRLADVIEVTRAAQVESCETGNRSRATRIRNYKREIAALDHDRTELKRLAIFIPGDVDLEGWIRSKDRAIADKRRSIVEEIESVAPTAISPGSSVRDCSNL